MFSAAHLKLLSLAAFALFTGVVAYIIRHDLEALRGKDDDERGYDRSLQMSYSDSTVPIGARRPTIQPAAGSRYPTYGVGIMTTPAPASTSGDDRPSAIFFVPGGGDAPAPGGGRGGGRPSASIVPGPAPVPIVEPVPIPIDGGAIGVRQSSSNTTTAIIVGWVVAGGVVVAIALIVAGIVVMCSKKRSASTQPGGGGVHPVIGTVPAGGAPSVPPPIVIPVASAVSVHPETEKVRAELEEQSPAKNPNSVVSTNTETTIGHDGSRNVVTTTVWADGRKQVETKSYPGTSV